MAEDNKLLYGTDEPLLQEVPITAGSISAIFVGGALRSIRYCGVEVVRGLHFLIRDRNWSTMVPTIGDLEIVKNLDTFSITFTAEGRTTSDDQLFRWKGRITASAESGIRFEAEGNADEDFKTCRTGFVVLHPLEKAAGCPVTLLHPDGSATHSKFPDRIDPLQSFFNIVGMSHSPLPGVTTTCKMHGGIWETEDHRNWLDASFKTYFRPLGLPWPYTIPKGEKVIQRVDVTFSGKPKVQASDDSRTHITLGDRTGGTVPLIGLMVESRELKPTFASAGFRPDTIAICPAMDLKGYPPSVDRPLGPRLEDLYDVAREAFPNIPMSGGTFSYFTELNRRQPPIQLIDMVQHAITSVNHAADDRSVMETLETLPHVFHSVRAICGNLPYRVGPVNIGMFHNPYGESLSSNPNRIRMTMSRNDPRHEAQFGAAWAAGFLARAASGGVHSVTMMSPTGDFGLLDREQIPPAAAVFQAFSEFAGGSLLNCATSEPQSVNGMAAEKDGRRIALITNLTSAEKDVEVGGWPVSSAWILTATGSSKFEIMKPVIKIIKLPPYAVVRLEG